MNTYTSGSTSALIVHAHPEPTSFCTSQASAAQESLLALGYSVKMIDLYAREWNPVLDKGEFAPFQGAFKPQREQQNAVKDGSLSPVVQEGLDALLGAELLVLSFPLWWFSVPAILKGWVDRVFVMGGLFGGDFGLFESAALAGRRAVLLTTTGGPETAFTPDGEFGGINQFLFPIHRGMLEFVGYDVLEPVITYGPARMDDAQRGMALDAVRESFLGIRHRPLIAGR